jgi:hypothetical protein
MARSSLMLIVILGLGGCAGVSTLSVSCAPKFAQSEAIDGQPDRLECDERAAGYERVAALGSVSQTGSQTRTVGVPRGFLMAMVVLIVLVGLV